mmetsp:Transcript_52808/g.145992  ORF Transcript_52808/g.145992 Transcript_52808/m.145992 type:complete len:142 (-) Transcript_52808:94-519(-)
MSIDIARLESLEAAAAVSRTVSIDAPAAGGGGGAPRDGGRALTPLDSLADVRQRDEAAEAERREGLADALGEVLDASLSAREAQVLRARYGLGLRDGAMRSLSEVAKQLGISSSRAQQLEASALEKLRGPAARSLSERLSP